MSRSVIFKGINKKYIRLILVVFLAFSSLNVLYAQAPPPPYDGVTAVDEPIDGFLSLGLLVGSFIAYAYYRKGKIS